MGLDWLVGARPAGESPEEGWLALRRATSSSPDSGEWMQRWRAFPVVNSWEVVGAPGVGFDAAADLWALERRRGEAATLESASAEDREFLVQMRGYWVLDLAPPCDGIPMYSNSVANPELERTSFRAAFLTDVRDVLGERLFAAAHERQLPPEFGEFCSELNRVSNEFAVQTGMGAVAARRECPEDDEGVDASRAHILASAARWVAYWNARGHWLDIWA